ncbi:2-octaprenyl-6-methoxyphenyl hydroxylase [Candidatus Palibaumannia cicadellinicola]|uniref:2-octaprenyl-6-methoxyphenol hydroxylase n=1 Tax=Candidatus Palibaumannia cicadellinicola TaxID=186490 RepID=A0A0K2BLG1_9GAMM|nr:2-octaprenyl-6-methoxyphenyl hydroxylase [Candidatus Baumannia cicadellinicola]AKZ66170.1 2-octaprenyl-6-methoxyphenol hydroxylase [Candidatus Baumannia cicadellinicola]
MTVTIIGCGLTGATLALALSKLTKGNITINVIEAVMPALDSSFSSSLSDRYIAITYSTCCELKSIGIWSVLASYATAITYVEVSNSGTCSKVGINAADYYLPVLGYVININHAKKKLFNLLQLSTGVKIYCPAVLKNINRNNQNTILTLDNGQQLISQLMVAADGTLSKLAVMSGIRWNTINYKQIAVIADVSTSLHHRGYAFEMFSINNGSLALLPIQGGNSSLIWCLPDKFKTEIYSWNNIKFCQVLQKKFGWRLGKINDVRARQYYNLKLCYAERHITHRVALIGNAAQTLHPILGQGFNLGLRDVITLAEILNNALVQGDDIGSYAVLVRYQQRRLLDQKKIICITDGLVKLLTNKNNIIRLGLNLGLFAFANIPCLRNILVRQIL